MRPNHTSSRRMTVKEARRVFRAKCLDCSGWQLKEIRLCTVTTCSIHPYRLGSGPEINVDQSAHILPKKGLRGSENTRNSCGVGKGLGPEFSVKKVPLIAPSEPGKTGIKEVP